TDIVGAEDALGDMDFKVAGTANVITALQLDTKLAGLPSDVLTGALSQAKDARLQILEVMKQAIAAPREELNKYAPRIESVEIPKDKIGEVIGPKGKVIREIEEETGATLEIVEEGNIGIVRIASNDKDVLEDAKMRVMMIANPPEPDLGENYEGTVVNITKFGAFINIIPGRDGLLHISKIDRERRVDQVEDYLELGQKVNVKLTEIDDRGKLSLELAEGEKLEPSEAAKARSGSGGGGGGREREGRDREGRDRGERGGRDRGDRGGRDGGKRDGDRDGGSRGRDRGGRSDRDGRGQSPRSGESDGAGDSKRRPAPSFDDAIDNLIEKIDKN
ncbi:MAG: S1 RNA-binding domain-containing protein, partial [Acidimicrobiia bacterium]|nr:S1 RNA-binding domain-containing protein [Acidimicrobiia bacterium]